MSWQAHVYCRGVNDNRDEAKICLVSINISKGNKRMQAEIISGSKGDDIMESDK